MEFVPIIRQLGLASACVLVAAGSLCAQGTSGEQAGPTRPDRDQLRQPIYKVAQQVDPTTGAGAKSPEPAEAEHPLVPALKIAYASLESARAIKDYSATMVKRERINDKLGE